MTSRILYVMPEGDLFFEQDLMHGSPVPMFFVCTNKNQEHFLCSTIDVGSNFSRYIIIKAEIDELLKMLEDKMTIRDFVVGKTKFFWDVNCENFTFECLENDFGYTTEIMEEYLPIAGEFLDEQEELAGYIQKLKEIQKKQEKTNTKIKRISAEAVEGFPVSVYYGGEAVEEEYNEEEPIQIKGVEFTVPGIEIGE